MPIQLGDKALKSLYIWDKKVSAVYIWDKKVWPSIKDFTEIFSQSHNKSINRSGYYRAREYDPSQDPRDNYIKIRPEGSGKIKLWIIPAYSRADLDYTAFTTHIDFTVEIEKIANPRPTAINISNPGNDITAGLFVRFMGDSIRVSYGGSNEIVIPMNREVKELFVSVDFILQENKRYLNSGKLIAVYGGQTYTEIVHPQSGNYPINRYASNTRLEIWASYEPKGYIAVKQIHIW